MDWNTTKPRSTDLDRNLATKKEEETVFFNFSYGYVSIEKLEEIVRYARKEMTKQINEVKERLVQENLPFQLRINVYDERKVGTFTVEIW